MDLALPDIDETALKGAVARAQKRLRHGSREMGAVRLVPVMDEKLARQMREMQGR